MLSATLRRSPEQALRVLREGDAVAHAADALEVPEHQLTYILYTRSRAPFYTTFTIPKKSGGERIIHAPKGSMEILQRKVLYILERHYRPLHCVNGFVSNGGIVKNAEAHTKCRFVVNVDLEDFYGSIHFGRVRGVLQRKPWHLPPKVATVLAHIVTYQGKLPQGACTSPLMSNLVSRPLDKKLLALAREHRLKYTRYADDITLSTSRRDVPDAVIGWTSPNPVTGDPIVGTELRRAIESAGFTINQAKVRIQVPGVRQEVTGLTVNEFVNVRRSYLRNIRALVHSWRTRGLLAAEEHHVQLHARRPPAALRNDGTYFKQVVYGHMAHLKQVRGADDRIYLKLCSDLALLDTSPPRFIAIGKDMLDMYDFFICHASEDKDRIVRPLDKELSKSAKVFVDEKYIRLGDSFIEKINHALGRSKHVIAVISTNSCAKHWPLRELNNVLAMEATKGQKLVPVMVGTDREVEDFLDRIPLISERLYHRWNSDKDPSDLASKLLNLIR